MFSAAKSLSIMSNSLLAMRTLGVTQIMPHTICDMCFAFSFSVIILRSYFSCGYLKRHSASRPEPRCNEHSSENLTTCLRQVKLRYSWAERSLKAMCAQLNLGFFTHLWFVRPADLRVRQTVRREEGVTITAQYQVWQDFGRMTRKQGFQEAHRTELRD
jgi:hypothetical protein